MCINSRVVCKVFCLPFVRVWQLGWHTPHVEGEQYGMFLVSNVMVYAGWLFRVAEASVPQHVMCVAKCENVNTLTEVLGSWAVWKLLCLPCHDCQACFRARVVCDTDVIQVW